MTCYYPITAYRSKTVNDSGKRSLVFTIQDAFSPVKVTVPCSRCVGCRLERSRQWAIRILCESKLHDRNIFVTLTYRDDDLPDFKSLRPKDFQDFMKRLRKCYGDGIRFFHCGEYGDQFGRPHYHAIIFNHDFDDKYQFKKSKHGFPIYRSDSLEKLWPFGFSEIGSVTFDSAAYVARYIMKKHLGENSILNYMDIDFGSGEVLSTRVPEYCTMSRRPGIAKVFFDNNFQDIYRNDFLVIRNGIRVRPPKYFDKQFEIQCPSDMENLKKFREKFFRQK